MPTRLFWFACSFACLLSTAPGFLSKAQAAEGLPKPFVTGLLNPESVAIVGDGKFYVSVIGEFDKDGDGAVVSFVPS